MSQPHPARPLRVVHLAPAFGAGDGPTHVVRSIVAASDPRVATHELWGMRAFPEPGRALDASGVGAPVRTFGMGGTILDARILAPLVRALREARVDVLHCHLVRAALYGPLAARLAGVPAAVVSAHNAERYMTEDDPVSRGVRAVERRTAALVARYVAVSAEVHGLLVRRIGLPAARCVTIRNGHAAVDRLTALGEAERATARATTRAALGVPDDAVLLGGVARLHPQKHFAALLDAAARLRAEGRDVRVVIAGEGPEHDALAARAAADDLRGAVRLLGFVGDPVPLLAAFDVYALPSRYEGVPMALIEAAAMGLPAVVTAVGGMPDVVLDGRTGYVIAPDAADALTDALRRLVVDPALRLQFGAAARRHVREGFGARPMARAYDALYASVSADAPARRSPRRRAARLSTSS